MNNILLIFKKQCKDTLKNKSVLIQFFMFPILGIVMAKTVHIPDMPANFFVSLFATMYIGMAPLTSISAILSEEKEKNTLRVLLLSGVSPAQYLIGIGSYVFFACMLGGCIFCCLLNEVSSPGKILFLSVMALGILASITLGAVIGIGSKNQAAATSVTVPVMMVFSFLPMLSIFNETIEKIARFTYSQQIRVIFDNLTPDRNLAAHVAALVLHIAVFSLLFHILYKKHGLA